MLERAHANASPAFASAKRRARAAIALLWLSLAGAACTSDLSRYLADDDGDVMRTTDTDDGRAGRDGGLDTPSDSDGGQNDEAPNTDGRPAFPYHWDPGFESGSFRPHGRDALPLRCRKDGAGESEEAPECVFRCFPGGPPTPPEGCGFEAAPGTLCAKEANRFEVHPGRNEFCVEIFPPKNDSETYAVPSVVECVSWDSGPFPLALTPLVLPSDTTDLQADIQCTFKEGQASHYADVDPSTCWLHVSLDGGPRKFHGFSVDLFGVPPGRHTLRYEVCHMFGSRIERCSETQEAEWLIGLDATPKVSVDVPPVLARDALGPLAELLDVYPGFAETCRMQVGYGALEPAQAASLSEELAAYLSAVVARSGEGSVDSLDAAMIGACRDVLSAKDPATCRFPPGMHRIAIGDHWLDVLLPDGCRFFGGPGPTPDVCMTEADCVGGPCVRARGSDPLGVCGLFDEPASEGLSCLGVGCEDGLFCQGICEPKKKLGEACNTLAPCREGLACVAGACVRPQCEGEICSSSRECDEGLSCVDNLCAAASADDTP